MPPPTEHAFAEILELYLRADSRNLCSGSGRQRTQAYITRALQLIPPPFFAKATAGLSGGMQRSWAAGCEPN